MVGRIGMKQVWILERFKTVDEMQQNINEYGKVLEQAIESKNEVVEKSMRELVDFYVNKLSKNPTGHWVGMVGKAEWSHFLKEVEETKKIFGGTFRVVEAWIPETNRQWVGYKTYGKVTVNETVTKKLFGMEDVDGN